jgi:regulator of replication initiation timing/cation transport regulator ChaC
MDNDASDPTKIVKELVDLAQRHPVKGVDLSRAKGLMRTLKQSGYTNNEIYHLTDKSWSESTIKLYTRNTTGTQRSLKTNHLKLFDEIIRNNLSMVELKKSLLFISELTYEASTFDDIIAILQYFQKEKSMIPYLTEFLSKLKDDGIKVEKLVQLAQYKDELDARGYDLDFMGRLFEFEKKYADRQKALQSIIAYDGIAQIESELGKTRNEWNELKTDIMSQKKELAKLMIQKEKLRTEISIAEELSFLGLTIMMLRELKELAGKYGHDIASLVKAINKYGEITELDSNLSSLLTEKANLNDSVEKLQTKCEHFGDLSKMCEFFLDKFKFDLHDIDLMRQMAARYGEPSEFFRALGVFSSLKEIEQKITDLRLEKIRLESGNHELAEKRSELETRIGTLRETVISTVEHISTGVGKVFSDTADKIGTHLEQNLTEIMKSYEEYSKLRARILASESTLKVAKIIRSIINNDLEMIRTIPVTYLSLFIQGALNICNAKQLNPTSLVDIPFSLKYGILPATAIQLVDLLGMGKVASESLISR